MYLHVLSGLGTTFLSAGSKVVLYFTVSKIFTENRREKKKKKKSYDIKEETTGRVGNQLIL